MDTALMALAIRRAHEEGLESVLEQARYITEEAAHGIRRLLVPILQRWGIGFRKGGILVYPKVGSSGLLSSIEVRLMSDEGYALRVVHPELYELLCTYNQVINKYVYEYVEDIPVGLNPWVWLTREWVEGCDEPLIGTMPCPSSNYGDPDKEYYGPINESLYGEVLTSGGDMVLLVNTLPQYKVEDGVWVEVENWFREVKE